MTELDTILPPQPTGVSEQGSTLAVWAREAQAAHFLASRLCGTAFAPTSFKGKPDEATAAILAGAEMGLSPLAALNAIDIIQGRPSLKAITLRALVLSAGHDIWVQESTQERCVVQGRRRGSEHTQTSTWTLERARQMQLTGKDQWVKQPGAMLVARATAECARLVAPDVLLGVPYSAEEVADFDPPRGGMTAVQAAPAEPARSRTVQRAPRPAAPVVEVPLPDVEPPADEPEPTAPAAAEPEVTRAQLGKMHALFGEKGMTDRALALAFVGDVVGRDVDSTKALSKAEASRVIKALDAEPAPAEVVEDVDHLAALPDEPLWPDAPGNREPDQVDWPQTALPGSRG